MASLSNSGNWKCVSCKHDNIATVLKCAVCEAPQNAYAALLPPDNWAVCDVTTPPRRIEVSRYTNEYKEIRKAMAACLDDTNHLRVEKIERIEHFALYQIYSLRKQQMILQNHGGQQVERKLYHGCQTESVDNIIRNGFNRGYSGRNGSSFGSGVYFSTDVCYSMRPRFTAQKSSSGLRSVFLCRVLTGEYTVGNERLVEPPCCDEGYRRFNSVVDQIKEPSVFVVFNDAQCIPEYLMQFTCSL